MPLQGLIVNYIVLFCRFYCNSLRLAAVLYLVIGIGSGLKKLGNLIIYCYCPGGLPAVAKAAAFAGG
jgi:hypothetical protein